MKIEFLISTMNQTDLTFLYKMFKMVNIEDVLIKIVNQCTKIPIPEFTTESNIVVKSLPESGLSNSRNTLLTMAEGDICIISDDDLVYDADVLEILKSSFNHYPLIDFMRFQITTPSGRLLHNYPSCVEQIRKNGSTSASSVELAFLRVSQKKSGVTFDSLFGLGSKFRSGEDAIFVFDSIDSGMVGLFIPKTIAVHPEVSSGIDYENDVELAWAKGAVLTRLFGEVMSLPVFLYFAFRQKRFYRRLYTTSDFLRKMMLGRKDFLEDKKRKP